MSVHRRGNTTDLHNDVQDKLVRIIEQKRKRDGNASSWIRVRREHTVPGIAYRMAVVDVVDESDPAHPVYYEVESQGSTARYKAKEAEFAKRLGKDLVLIDLQELRRACPELCYSCVMAWLEGKVI